MKPTTAIESDPRLERLLGGTELALLRQRLRRYFERQAGPQDDERVAQGGRFLQLTQLSPSEHEAIALLTGRRSRLTRSTRIDIGRMDASLQAAGIAGSLREALERLDGPIVNRAAQRAEAEAAWSAIADTEGRDPRLYDWLQTPAAGTLLKRLTRQDIVSAETLLAQADDVLCRLPATGLTRSQLAAETLGDAHALDAGRPAASIVLATWRHTEDSAPSGDSDDSLRATGLAGAADLPDLTEARNAANERARDIWARAGVLVNELARPVLVLNLPIRPDESVHWAAGEPAYLSLRQLLRAPPAWLVVGKPVFVCENPNLLAIAADRLGARCAPLVCTDGMPSAAQRTLLTQLANAGARLRYHGDFDWPGIRIANHVLRSFHAQTWRMSATDYEAAARASPHVRRELTGPIVEATWDPQLAQAMDHHGLAIAEESVAESLIDELRSPGPESARCG